MLYTPMIRQLDDDQAAYLQYLYEKTLGAQTAESILSAKNDLYAQYPEARYEIWLDYLARAVGEHYTMLVNKASPEDAHLALPRGPVSSYLSEVESHYMGVAGENPSLDRVKDVDSPHLAWLRAIDADAARLSETEQHATPAIAARYMLDTEGLDISFADYLAVRRTSMIDRDDVGQFIPIRQSLEWFKKSDERFIDGEPTPEMAAKLSKSLEEMEASSELSVVDRYTLYKAHNIHPCHEANVRQWADRWVKAKNQSSAYEDTPIMRFG